MAETFWKCTVERCGAIHHYPSPNCQKCGAAVKKITVDDTKSLQKLLGVRIEDRSKKSQKKLDIGQG